MGNTIVLLLWTIPKCPEFITQRLNTEYFKALAKYYKALTWAEEDALEDGDKTMALSSTDLEKDGVYLIRYLKTGTLKALELYNDSIKEIDIHRTETQEMPRPSKLAYKVLRNKS